ncbi:GCN5 family acetyltransferase [Zobellella denitrificans]|uniref:GCN5 family acetyltransferase n=1 Tax=Zobellella denitrificans TaxID=347534 RepID=A0A291HNW1_9GAMM|nr:GNAT family N-acetyltransferase [Zobellella denitrificans]ATG73860.1 GCN5 family acetyltransferase [Zobellella denitrificans]
MGHPISLHTQRLHLRQWRPEDRAPFAALNADPEAMRYFPAPLSRAQSDALADRIEGLIAERGWGFWALECRQSRTFLGFTGLHVPAAELPCSPCVEIGWRLAREHWGWGYASEAASACLAFGFEQLGLGEIVSFTALDNLRSRAVMERLGMVADAATFEHPAVPPGSPLREHCLYRLSAASWLAR